MRLWHYELIPYLPKSQLLAQWRELNSIFKKQNNHILINYIYEYHLKSLYHYSKLVLKEMDKRKIKVKNMEHFDRYFSSLSYYTEVLTWNPFPQHHNFRYLTQCYYNLQEKYDRGQKDFTKEEYAKLTEFFMEESLIYEI